MSFATSKLSIGRNALALAVATTALSQFACAAPPALINPTGTPSGAVASTTPKGEGLDGLDDSILAAELSGRGINNLLDYYFKASKVSEQDQTMIRTLGALNGLDNPNIKPGEKVRRVKDLADGIDAILPLLKDPAQMIKTAGVIIEFGVTRDVNNIEYWGEDPVTQAHLKPMANAVVKLLDAASRTARNQADAMAKTLTGSRDANGDRWEKLDVAASTAAYNKNMAVYFAALALPQKDPARKTMADKAIAFLSDFDNPDSGVQARVRNMTAKLQMVAGAPKDGKALFATVYADKSEVMPAPNPFEIYESRYFAVVCDLMAQDLAAAQADKAALDGWQTTVMPKLLADAKLTPAAIEEEKKGIDAAGQMLQWRLTLLQGELTKSVADKKTADDTAEAILLKLRETRPDLAPIIDEQLVKRSNKPVDANTPASLLIALMKKGTVESYKADADKPDMTVLDKGIQCARMIIARKEGKGISSQQVDEAMLTIPILQERMGKKVEAANGYLDYAIASSKTNPKKATDALDRVGFLVFDMKKQPATPAGFADIYARFLPIAIQPPFNHKELAYPYAEQLRSLKNYKEAVRFFRMVPADSAAFSSAQYKQMLALSDLLDTKQDPAEHKLEVADLQKVAGEVRKLGEHPKDQFDRSKAVQASLVLADLARVEQKDPKRALAALEGFDALVKGLPGEADLLRGALIARVNSYMALGQTNDAVQELTKLIENAKGDEGIVLVRQLLDQLDKEFSRASVDHNTAVMRDTARNEAMLTHYLVDWCNPATQKNAKISQLYYAYAVYDAQTQRLAGSLAEDPAERKKLLLQAKDRYDSLKAKDMHDLYIAQPNIKKRIADDPEEAKASDPAVDTGLALAEFDLGDYEAAKKQLEPLIGMKRLGTPQVEVINPQTGAAEIKDNDLYWEATYKFLKSAYEMGKSDKATQSVMEKSLKNLLIRGGIPDRWQEQFTQLQKDAIPGFNPSGTVTAAPIATQPAASAK